MSDPNVTPMIMDQRSGRKIHVTVCSPIGTSTPRSRSFTLITELGVPSIKTFHPGAQVSIRTMSRAQSVRVRITMRSGRSFVTVPNGGDLDCPSHFGVVTSDGSTWRPQSENVAVD